MDFYNQDRVEISGRQYSLRSCSGERTLLRTRDNSRCMEVNLCVAAPAPVPNPGYDNGGGYYDGGYNSGGGDGGGGGGGDSGGGSSGDGGGGSCGGGDGSGSGGGSGEGG